MPSIYDIFGNAKGLKGLLSDEEIGSVQGDSLLQASLALMAAGGPSASPVSFGQALSNAYGKGREAFKGGIESQVGNVLTAQKIREFQREQDLRKALMGNSALAQSQTVTPQQALAGGGGPTVGNAEKIGQTNPAAVVSEYQRLMRNAETYQLYGKDELYFKAIEAAEKLRPIVAQYVDAMDASGMPIKQGYDKQGQPMGAAIPQAVKPENVDLGGKISRINPYTGQVIGDLGKTMSFADRNAAGNLAINQDRLALDRQRFDFDKTVGKPAPETFSKGAAAYSNLSNALNNYESLISNGGITSLPSGKKQELKTAYQDILLQAKEAYNLGVLNGPDLQILESVIVDPTSLGSNFNPAVGEKGVLNNIKQVRDIVERQRQSLQGTYGREIPQTKPIGPPPVNRSIGGGGVTGFNLGELPMNAIDAELRRRGQ